VSPLVAILRSFCAGCLLSAGTLTAVAGTLAESARVDVLEDTLTGSSQGWEVLAYGSRVQLAKEEGALAGDWGMEIRSFPRRTEAPSTDGVDQQWRIGLDRRFEGGNGIHTEGLFDESGFGPYAKGYRHSILYDWAILETENFRVSLGPGLVGDYALEPANGEERFNMMSRFGQSLSWRLHEGIVIRQNLDTTVDQTPEDDFATVLNLDLETLFADRLSFRMSYEVHYEDTENQRMERQDARLSTSIGYRF
jgi:hypothetical protein